MKKINTTKDQVIHSINFLLAILDTSKAKEEIRQTVSFAYIDPNKKNSLSQWFIPIWNLRWLGFIAVSIIWWKHPRTIYLTLFLVDIAMVVLAVISINGFWSPLGILFMVEEALVMFWHFSQLLLFIDYYKGDFESDGKMGDGATKLWVWVTLIGILGAIVTEILIWVLGLLAHESAEEAVKSSEMELDIAQSGTELNNKIATFSKMKTRKANNEDQDNEEAENIDNGEE